VQDWRSEQLLFAEISIASSSQQAAAGTLGSKDVTGCSTPLWRACGLEVQRGLERASQLARLDVVGFQHAASTQPRARGRATCAAVTPVREAAAAALRGERSQDVNGRASLLSHGPTVVLC
jgi:hypothetical protein